MIEATCDCCGTKVMLTDATLRDRTCPGTVETIRPGSAVIPCPGYLVLTGPWVTDLQGVPDKEGDS